MKSDLKQLLRMVTRFTCQPTELGEFQHTDLGGCLRIGAGGGCGTWWSRLGELELYLPHVEGQRLDIRADFLLGAASRSASCLM